MPFPKLNPNEIIVGDRAVMYAPWTPLPPKKVIIFNVFNDTIKVISENDDTYEFNRHTLEYKTETGYSWELRSYDEKIFNEYSYKLEELVEARKLKKDLGKIVDQIKDHWIYVEDLDKLRRIITLLEIVKAELGVG